MDRKPKTTRADVQLALNGLIAVAEALGVKSSEDVWSLHAGSAASGEPWLLYQKGENGHLVPLSFLENGNLGPNMQTALNTIQIYRRAWETVANLDSAE